MNLVSLLRKTLREIDPNVPLYNLSTLESQLDDSLSRDRLITWLSTAFGVLATLLATIGLYGVIPFPLRNGHVKLGSEWRSGRNASMSCAWSCNRLHFSSSAGSRSGPLFR